MEHFWFLLLTGEDGTFDILKYADPDLDLGSDNKTIFDDLADDTKEHEDKKEGAEENKVGDGT